MNTVASLPAKLRWMIADANNLGVNERTIDLAVLEEAAAALATSAAEGGKGGLPEWARELLARGNWREVHPGRRCMKLSVTYELEAWERLMAELESTPEQPGSAEEAVGYLVDGTDFYHLDFPRSEWSKHESVVPVFTQPPAPAAEQGDTTCPKCGATSEDDAGSKCIPDGDTCPGVESPLAEAWTQPEARGVEGMVDDRLSLPDVAGVLGEIAEQFDGGEYSVSEEARRVLIDFAHGLPDHPLFITVGHYFAQNPVPFATPNPVRAEQPCTCPQHPDDVIPCPRHRAEQPEGKGAEFRGLDVSGRPVYGHAKAASVTAAPTSAPAAPVVDDEFADLRTFYNVETDAELIRIQAQHVERLQKKLPRNDQPIRTKPRFA